MNKPDVLLCAPYHMDYPYFRYNLPLWEQYFKKVFIALTQDTMSPNLGQWIINCPEYKNVKWVRTPKKSNEDWRSSSVRDMLISFSKAPYVLFLEQDFLLKDISFWDKVISALDTYDWVYYREVDRIHPAFSLIRRDLLDKTCLDFSAHPPHDHFGEVFRELEHIVDKKIELKELGFKDKVDFYSQNGLTNNYWVHQLKQPFYKEEEFLCYNYLCQKLPIIQNGEFLKLCKEITDQHGKGDYEGFISNFFPKEEEI